MWHGYHGTTLGGVGWRAEELETGLPDRLGIIPRVFDMLEASAVLKENTSLKKHFACTTAW